MKKLTLNQAFVFVTLAFLTCGAHAAPIIYPAKGQNAQQQQKDDGECFSWAKTNTGVDPVAVSAASTTPPPANAAGGERVRGAARGALGGAAIGAIAGDADKGAAIGAVGGTMAGGARARGKQTATQQQSAATAQQNKTSLDTYNRAYAACMEGRGYSLK